MQDAGSETWTVDAIEEGIAAIVVEGRRLIHVPLASLPPDVREGDVLAVTRTVRDGGAVTLDVRIDREATEAAFRRSREQLARMPRSNDPGGDIHL
jgi:hypothetical protein